MTSDAPSDVGAPGFPWRDVHNVRVSETSYRSPARLTALALAAVLSLAACSGDPGGEGSPSGSPSGSPTVSPTSDVSVPSGVELTAQGSDLSFGDTATVVYEPDQNTGTVLELTVKNARKGTLDDFRGFVLDDPYEKQANYYYVKVSVTNVGEENVGGQPVPLWGVNGENTLLPAVNFTKEFSRCSSAPLPAEFQPGDEVDTCLVYLSPDEGELAAVSFRPDQAFDPIEWTGEVKPPKKDEPKNKKKRNRN